MEGNDTGNSNNSLEDKGMRFDASRDVRIIVLSILIVIMNTAVILLFAFNKYLRKPYNFLLVSLSVSDLLTGLVGLPLIVVCSARPFCLPCVFAYSFVVFTSISTVLHILVISYERYLKIVFPFRVQQIGRASFELRLVACLWLVSCLVPLIQYIWYPPTPDSCTMEFTAEIERHEKNYTISIMVIFVGLPVLLLIYADVSVFFVVRRQLDGIDKTSVGLRDSQRRLKKETRVLVMFAVMMLYFVIAWSFYYAALIAHAILQHEFYLPDWFTDLVNILRATTPLVNPILYILLKNDFRRIVWTGIKRFVSTCSPKKKERTAQHSNDGTPTICQTDSRNVTERTMFL